MSEVCRTCGILNPTIARFCHACGALLQRSEQNLATAAIEIPAAERRPLTIMFCDLVGSTELSSRLDPEELSALIRQYQDCVSRIVRSSGGFVARFVGDGILIYYGWPVANETDAEQAVKSALTIAKAVPAIPTPNASLQVRIGIATGLVVIGETIGSGESQQQTAIGLTPNRAARLQAVAGSNEVVIDVATRRLIADVFDLFPLGAIAMKGLAEPEEAFEVRSMISRQSRFEALHARRLTPHVDRQSELEILHRSWQQVLSNQSHVVHIAGEPGIGKSRLAVEIESVIAEESCFHYYCSANSQDSPFHPIVDQIEAATGIGPDDEVAGRTEKLRQYLAPLQPTDEQFALLGTLVRIPCDATVIPDHQSPEQRKAGTIQALLWMILRSGESIPLLLLFEDIHWADPSTLELIGRLIPAISTRRVLLLATYRPEFQAPWTSSIAIILERLSHDDAATLALQSSAPSTVSPMLIDSIVSKSDGNPLFLEELTAAMMDTAVDGGQDMAAISVPENLRASLLSRLDRLGRSKAVAQLGAVLGREFPFKLMAALLHSSADELSRHLGVLVASHILQHDGRRDIFAFKHALIRDAAYESLLLSRRRKLHQQVAEVIEASFPEIIEAQPGLLARHYGEGGCHEAAIPWWLRAAEQNIRRFANLEAIEQLHHALEALSRLPQGRRRDQFEMEIRTTLGIALAGTGSYISEDWRTNIDRVLVLASEVGAIDRLLQNLLQKWRYLFATGSDMRGALSLARDMLGIAGTSREHEPGAIIVAHRLVGMSLLACGDVRQARLHLERSMARGDADEDVRLAYTFPFNQRLAGKAYLALALCQGGQAKASRRVCAEAIARDHAPTTELVLSMRLGVHILLHEPAELHATATQLLSLLQRHPNRGREVVAASVLALLGAGESDRAADLSVVERGIEELQGLNWHFWIPWLKMMMAQVHLSHQRPNVAQKLLDELDALIETTGYALLKSDVCRLRAELMRATHQPATVVERQLALAIDAARVQGAALPYRRALAMLADRRRQSADVIPS